MFLESSPGFQQSISSDKFFARLTVIVGIFALSLFSAGCSSISHAAPSPSNQANSANVRVNVTPATSTVVSGGKQQFTATLTSTSNTAVSWTASAGTISRDGLFVAPTVTSPVKVMVTATSAAQLSSLAFSEVVIVPLSNLAITMTGLPAGAVNVPYSAILSASGGTAPYQWAINSGTLPQGIALNKNSGSMSGTTSQAGTFNFGISVTDSKSQTATASLSLSINTNQSTGNFDGPAELPRVYMQSDLADTPAPGSVISVPSGGDFQQALNSAKCGDTIELQAGAVFTGQFNLPALGCDDNHWIIVRTSAPDSSLPPESTRLTPCYAGVASLPARPVFPCSSPKNVLAKIALAGTGSGPLIFLNGATHYRFIGLEITRTPKTGVVFDLAVREGNGTADHIIFDRCWLHGTAQDETQRGVMMSGMQYVAVIDSYLSDFHCISITGACVDSQAVAGGLGDNPMGPFKIVDNYLEAAAENVLMGGDEATTTPTDIEIRHNHMFKPMIWMQGQPGFVGGPDGHPFIVKNLFELKNAQRVLLEGNVLEDSWGGFSQAGFAIGMGPKNQAAGNKGVCPLCQVTDITIRYVKIRHVGGGLQLGNGLSDIGTAALAGDRYSVHDITAEDIDPVKYNGYGDFAQVSTGPHAPVLHDVTINHVTAFQPGVMLNIGDDITVNQPMNNFVYTNNITNAGPAPTKTTGGGPANCAYAGTPNIVLPKCFLQYTFSKNAIVATPSNYPPSQYPAGNYFPASTSAVDFVNYNNGLGGDYHLSNSSPYKNAGTDGKDLGADIDMLDAATAGVE